MTCINLLLDIVPSPQKPMVKAAWAPGRSGIRIMAPQHQNGSRECLGPNGLEFAAE